MTAREFQDALPPFVVAYVLAEAAGIPRKTWGQMVYREQRLTADQLHALAAACDRFAGTLRAFGQGLLPPEHRHGLEHRGYFGSVEYAADDRVLHGRILGIGDVVTYEAASVAEIEPEFRASVDFYLDHCAATQKEPERP